MKDLSKTQYNLMYKAFLNGCTSQVTKEKNYGYLGKNKYQYYIIEYSQILFKYDDQYKKDILELIDNKMMKFSKNKKYLTLSGKGLNYTRLLHSFKNL